MAYTSDESGSSEVYVQSYPSGEKNLVSKGGGREPRWRADGKELFYLDPANNLVSVEIKTAPHFEAGAPRKLFTARVSILVGAYSRPGYDVSPDGKRFLINTVGRAPEQTAPITVVLNWRGGIAASSGGGK